MFCLLRIVFYSAQHSVFHSESTFKKTSSGTQQHTYIERDDRAEGEGVCDSCTTYLPSMVFYGVLF